VKNRINTLLVILCVLSFYSCIFKNRNQHSFDNRLLPIDSTILQFDSITILGKHFDVIYTKDYLIYVFNGSDTVAKLDCNNGFEFTDFNNDGFTDILIPYMTNIAGIQNVLQFDPNQKLFKQIENLTNYPSPILIDNNYYYSYSRAGCADNYWVSYLFRIEDFHTICLGEIWGQGCEPESMKIDIFKVSSVDCKEKRLIETLPLDTIYKFQETKWGFIKYYWTNKFLGFK
jgi:hypothetical protein